MDVDLNHETSAEPVRPTPKPNFFIVGAPKSGTTALYSYLQQHPEIFMCTPKEPQFFAEDTCGVQRGVCTLPEYLARFAEARTAVIGEASTCYLASVQAPKKIKEFSPDARIVIMLRNPVDVMHAEHSERMIGGMEHISQFGKAVDSDEPRYYRYGPFHGERVVRPSYRELVRFSQQIQRYFDVFGQARVHVIFYDDFTKDIEGTYRRLLAFLDVSQDHECLFDVVNANRRVRSMRVHDLVSAPPTGVRRLVRAIFPQPTRRKLGSLIRAINESFVPRPEMDPGLRRRLLAECTPDVQELSKMLKRDLSVWLAA